MARDGARRLLGAQLHRLRNRVGKSGRDLAAEVGISQSTLSRIERGLAVPTVPQVLAWAQATDVGADDFAALVSLAEAARAEGQPYEEMLDGRSHLQGTIREQEAATRTLLTFAPIFVPGLLQTAEYAQRVIALTNVAGRIDLRAALAGRLERQGILHESGRELGFLITEAALRWRPGGPASVVTTQLDRIVSVGALDTVEIGVLPAEVMADAIPWATGFTIYDDRDDGEPSVGIELPHEYLTPRRPEHVDIYRALWDRLHGVALLGPEAAAFIRNLAGESDRQR